MTTTYRDSGVDIEAGNAFASLVGKLARVTHRPEVVGGIGGFAALMKLPAGLREPLIVSCCDGVGTKLKVANLVGRHYSIGIDLVAMNVNDLICCGAEPLAFLDYFSTSKLEMKVASELIEGVVAGCKDAGCALVGGETAEMPGVYSGGEYDVAGFSWGVVDAHRIIDGSRAQAGDVVVGLPSSGLHSNGFSLVRRVLVTESTDLNARVDELGSSLGDELLKPTRIYVSAMKRLAAMDVHAVVHVTGGGLLENPPRTIPKTLAFRLFTDRWTVPGVMKLIARQGNVPEADMWRTYNMGIGLLVVLPKAQADEAVALLRDFDARVVGELIPRASEPVELIGATLSSHA